MAKLTKEETKRHNDAEALLQRAESTGLPLAYDEREFVLNHWLPAANHNVGAAGIFFTPAGIANDAMIETDHRAKRVLDLCAGIGMLAYHRLQGYAAHERPEMVCVEINPAFVRIGKLIVPEARWVCASMLDCEAIRALGRFDEVISNPPFGRISSQAENTWTLPYNAGLLQYAAAQIALQVADRATFIMAQGDLPWRYSGYRHFEWVKNERYDRFSRENGITFEPNCGIDTTNCEEGFHGTNITVEIVCVEKTVEHKIILPAQQCAQGSLLDIY